MDAKTLIHRYSTIVLASI